MAWTTKDEGPHQPRSTDPLWQESVVLYWRDAANGIGGAHRIGHEANWDGAGRCGLWSGIFTDDGLVFRTNLDNQPIVPVTGAGFGAGAHRMFHDGAVLRYEAEEEGLSISLVIEDVPGTFVDQGHGEANYNAADGSGEAEFFSHHMESHCAVRGTVKLDGRTIAVDGKAWRDHSWGIRHWDDIWGCRFFAGGDGTDANRYTFLAVVTPSGQLRRMGTLRLGGKDLEVESVRGLAHVGDDGLSIPAADIAYTLKDGTIHVLNYVAVGGHVAHTRVVSWESVGDISLNGAPLGWALLEGVNNHRGSTNAPVFVLNDAMTNGLTRHAR